MNNINNKQTIKLSYKFKNGRIDIDCNSQKHLENILSTIANAYTGLYSEFPLLVIAGYVIGFISVVSWVGFGYFANAICVGKNCGNEDPTLYVCLNAIAFLMDTAACGFVIYSLMAGVPFFSIPVIVAASVSLVLRIIFAIYLGNQIYEVKKQVKEKTEWDQTSQEIEKYIKDHTPKTEEPKKEEKNKDKNENKEKPKETIDDTDKDNKDKNNNDIPMGTGNQ